MGVKGLLVLLKSIQKHVNLGKFAGQTIGVDAYGWLHRGTVACATDLATGKPTRAFVDFAMHRVRMLQHFGVTPFLVFDGDYLPSKAATETDRAKRREESRKLGMELLHAGKISNAHAELQKAVDVTPEMARQLIDELKACNIQYIVAPYEADAQLVYLERKGLIQGILSEDSDLLVFGAKCLLTKLDNYGACVEINRADFCACREINLTGWTDAEFRCMAILSGCDYLANISNMGLKTAHRMVRKYKTIDKILRMLAFDGKYHIPKGYLEEFRQAELTFLHQRVFCPFSNELVYHVEPDTMIEDGEMPFIGAHVEPSVAIGVAIGDLNPMTKTKIIRKDRSEVTRRRDGPSVRSRPQLRRATIDKENEKPWVSIEEFFKLKRIPLGEMDPNSFKNSPSQHQALLRNGGSWPAVPILLPRPYVEVSTPRTEPDLPRPYRSSNGHYSGSTLLWSNTVSATRPPKRPRLCEDTSINALSSTPGSDNSGHSRFFGSVQPSPTLLKSKTQFTKREEAHLYSDDSIEEAMLNLPDVNQGWQRPTSNLKAVPIFDDAQARRDPDIASTLGSTDASKFDTTQFTGPSSAQQSSAASSVEEPALISREVPPILNGIKSRFAFTPIQSPASSASCISIGLPTPPSSARPSRIPVPVQSASPAARIGKPLNRSNISTPLQTLGARALNRSNALATPPYTPPSISSSRSNVSKFMASKVRIAGGVPFPDVVIKRPSSLKVEINPADIALPEISPQEEKDLAHVEPQCGIDSIKPVNIFGHGSEDLIVHDSEDDEENLLSPITDDLKTSAPNLDRFAFRA